MCRIIKIIRLVKAVFLLIILSACSKPSEQQEKQTQTQNQSLVEIPELGLSMQIPASWQKGSPTVRGVGKYKAKESGRQFFESIMQSYPFGGVKDFSLSGWKSLDEYVSDPISLHGKIITKIPKTLGSFQAIEVIGEALGENKIPVKGIFLYIQKGDRVIVVFFWAVKDSFARYESTFRSSLDSLTIR